MHRRVRTESYLEHDPDPQRRVEPQSVKRFSEKIMPNQNAEAR
jgi:hypothetical protein